MAVFVFFSASTGAGFVTTYLWYGSLYLCPLGLRTSTCRGCCRCSTGGKLTQLLMTSRCGGNRLPSTGLLRLLDFNINYHSGYLASDVINEGVEYVEAFQLVFQ